MREVAGNIWDYPVIVITTNGSVRKDGKAVMGRGIALQAAERYPILPLLLGESLRKYGNQVFTRSMYLHGEHIIYTFPVKHQWHEKASLDLIRQSAEQLAQRVEEVGYSEVALVRPGCGNGGLLWEQVKPIIAPILDDRFVVVEKFPGLEPEEGIDA